MAAHIVLHWAAPRREDVRRSGEHGELGSVHTLEITHDAAAGETKYWTACSSVTPSESPRMIIVGAVMPWMSSSGHEKSVVSSLVLSTSTGNFSGCGADAGTPSSNGEPANNSGVLSSPRPPLDWTAAPNRRTRRVGNARVTPLRRSPMADRRPFEPRSHGSRPANCTSFTKTRAPPADTSGVPRHELHNPTVQSPRPCGTAAMSSRSWRTPSRTTPGGARQRRPSPHRGRPRRGRRGPRTLPGPRGPGRQPRPPADHGQGRQDPVHDASGEGATTSRTYSSRRST